MITIWFGRHEVWEAGDDVPPDMVLAELDCEVHPRDVDGDAWLVLLGQGDKGYMKLRNAISIVVAMGKLYRRCQRCGVRTLAEGSNVHERIYSAFYKHCSDECADAAAVAEALGAGPEAHAPQSDLFVTSAAPGGAQLVSRWR